MPNHPEPPRHIPSDIEHLPEAYPYDVMVSRSPLITTFEIQQRSIEILRGYIEGVVSEEERKCLESAYALSLSDTITLPRRRHCIVFWLNHPLGTSISSNFQRPMEIDERGEIRLTIPVELSNPLPVYKVELKKNLSYEQALFNCKGDAKEENFIAFCDSTLNTFSDHVHAVKIAYSTLKERLKVIEIRSCITGKWNKIEFTANIDRAQKLYGSLQYFSAHEWG